MGIVLHMTKKFNPKMGRPPLMGGVGSNRTIRMSDDTYEWFQAMGGRIFLELLRRADELDILTEVPLPTAVSAVITDALKDSTLTRAQRKQLEDLLEQFSGLVP